MGKERREVPDSERCDSVNVASIRQKRCAQRANATVAHPDLGKEYRLCKTHAKDYTSAVQMATGWRVTFDEKTSETKGGR